MTDAFIAHEMPKRARRLTAWLVLAGVWLLTAQAFGLLAPLGIAPMAGTDRTGRILGLGLALLMTWMIRVLVKPRGSVRVRIDREGIDWRGPGRRRVRWADVERIGHKPLGAFLRAAASATDTVEPGFGPIAVWLKPDARSGLQAAGNRAIGYGDINLTVLETDRTRAELKAALEAFAPAHLLTESSLDSPSDGAS